MKRISELEPEEHEKLTRLLCRRHRESKNGTMDGISTAVIAKQFEVASWELSEFTREVTQRLVEDEC